MISRAAVMNKEEKMLRTIKESFDPYRYSYI